MDRALFDFVEYSAPLDLARARQEAALFGTLWDARERTPVLYHPVHINLYGPALESVEALGELDAHARAVGSAWVGNDVGWWHQEGRAFPGYLYLPPPMTEAGVRDAAVHALHVQSHLGVPLLLENPAVIALRGELHVLDFMARLHAQTGLGLLLDVGHLWSYQLSRGLPADAAFDGFPWEVLAEVHIAGGVATRRGGRRFYVDDHAQPVREELFELLAQVVDRAPTLRAITFEGDGHPEPIAAATLRRLRPVVEAVRRRGAPGHSPAPLAKVARPLETRPWELYEERHGARPPSEDPEGTAAELDFRAAVIAEEVDRQMPWTRLLLAGTRADLVGFTSSDALREVFTGMARDLHHAFAAWARSRARELADPGIDRVVAFETWLHAQHSAPASEGGTLCLSRGLILGEFPADLSEVAFCARGLRRHLVARAWASETLETSALEALRQAAQRAPVRSWRFAARRSARAIELLPVDEPMLELLFAVKHGGEGRGRDPDRLAAALERGWVSRR